MPTYTLDQAITVTSGNILFDSEIADLDGDGWLDFVSLVTTSTGTSGSLRVFFGTAPGGFESTSTDFVFPGARAVRVGDFTPHPVTPNLASLGFGLRLDSADVNGDGHLDLACSAWSGGSERIYLNDGLGNLTLALSDPTPNGNTAEVSFADIDGDGDPDLLVAHRNRTSQVVLNDGDGNFDVEPLGTTLGQACNILAADLNNDGVMDLFRGNIGEAEVWFGE